MIYYLLFCFVLVLFFSSSDDEYRDYPGFDDD